MTVPREGKLIRSCTRINKNPVKDRSLSAGVQTEEHKSLHLPTECLFNIFSYLADERQSLYSCILVNRHWCRAAISVLWSRPFVLLYLKTKKKHKSPDTPRREPFKLLRMCLVCLGHENSSHLLMKLKKRKERPLFDYLSFIEELHVRDLCRAVLQGLAYKKKKKTVRNVKIKLDKVLSKFTEQITMRTSHSFKEEIKDDALGGLTEFAGTMCQLLLNNCHRLKTLCVQLDIDLDGFADPYRRIKAYIADSHGLSTLTEFEWRANAPSAELLQALTNATSKLTTVRVYRLPLTSWDDTRVGESLITLIRGQRKLVHFELGWTGRDCTSIVEALEHHSSTLQSLHFIGVSFRSWKPLKILSSTTQLRSIKFHACRNVTAELLDSLAHGRYPCLTSLDFCDTRVPSSLVESMLSNCGNTLESVNLGEAESCSYLIELVNVLCPKVSHFGAVIESEDTPLLLKYLLEHHHMKSLEISGPVADMDWLFLALSIQEFPNLRHLTIKGARQQISPQTLEIFLSKSGPPIEQLKLVPCFGKGDCYTEVVLRFLKGTLKDFNMVVTESGMREDLINRAEETIEKFECELMWSWSMLSRYLQ
ncbi:2917_t:CDS:1 [Paraglomus occultum]|uniref:2917_t:CDS:1 n=1 Tax=Paraglomus occultum TaxID=144539 RepID=A0A9N9AKR5_9GLOM|nr:2917_t:CDS:1 [Paraglomus occultum]